MSDNRILDLDPEIISLLQGWEYVNEGKLVDKPKWGYVSWAVGSKIVLKVSSQFCIKSNLELVDTNMSLIVMPHSFYL